MLVLPDEVGQTHQNDDPRGNPKPLTTKPAPLGSKEKTSRETNKKKNGRVFVFQSQPKQHAAPNQQLRLIAVHRAQQKVNAAYPEKGLERVHGKAGAIAEDHRSHQHRQTRQQHREPPAAEFPRDQTGEDDLGAISERWQEPDRVQGIPKQKTADSQEERGQRSKVHIAPGEMIAGRDVIKFVAKIAVAAIGRYLQQHGRDREQTRYGHATRKP